MHGTGNAMTDLPSPLSAQRPHSQAVFSTAMCHDTTTAPVRARRHDSDGPAQGRASVGDPRCVNFQYWHQRYTKALPIPEVDG